MENNNNRELFVQKLNHTLCYSSHGAGGWRRTKSESESESGTESIDLQQMFALRVVVFRSRSFVVVASLRMRVRCGPNAMRGALQAGATPVEVRGASRSVFRSSV